MRYGPLLLALLAVLVPRGALGHGGLPVTSEILWRGDTLYVPTIYWGIFVGTDGGTWRWICDEAINGYKLRQVFQGGDGTLYATDVAGLTLSRDGGCTWVAAGTELSMLTIDTVVPDPQGPARAYALAGLNGLWRTDDSGRIFQRLAAAPPLLLRGLVIGGSTGSDGQLTLLATQTGVMQVPMLFRSTDGGASFSTPVAIAPLPAGVPSEQVVFLGLDPREQQTGYVRFQGDPTQVLARVDLATGAASEVLRLDNTILDVSIDGQRDRLLISTGNGLYYADGSRPAQRSPALSRAQCTSARGGTIYACSWDYYPDMAAVARSTDGGQSFHKVFQYTDTVDLVACPAQSSVGQICPSSWALNAPLLGIMTGGTTPPDMGVRAAPAGGCSSAPDGKVPWPTALAVLTLALLLRRRPILARPAASRYCPR